jgi:hypothetical protein
MGHHCLGWARDSVLLSIMRRENRRMHKANGGCRSPALQHAAR